MRLFMRALLALTLAASLMTAGERDAVRVEVRNGTLAEALKQVEAATGQAIDAPAGLLDGKTVTFVARGTPDELIAAFAVTLEKSNQLTLLPGENGALRLHRFIPATGGSARPAPRGRRLTVRVAEGAVALVGDRGRVTVRAGEMSSVSAGTLPTEPRAFDVAATAPWRLRDAPAPSGMESTVALPPLRCRWLGDTPDGKAILEIEVEGVRQTLVFGDLEVAGIDRRRQIVEGQELELMLPVKLTLNRPSK